MLLDARRWLAANGERVVATIVSETGRPPDETQFAELAYGLSASADGSNWSTIVSNGQSV